MVTDEQMDDYARLLRMRLVALADQEDREDDELREAQLRSYARERKRTMKALRDGIEYEGRVPICPTCRQPMRLNP